MTTEPTCVERDGHVGWLTCPVHNAEIQAKVAQLQHVAGGSGAGSTEWELRTDILTSAIRLICVQGERRGLIYEWRNAEHFAAMHEESLRDNNVRLRAELEAARSIIARLAALGQDDGSTAADNAWREAFTFKRDGSECSCWLAAVLSQRTVSLEADLAQARARITALEQALEKLRDTALSEGQTRWIQDVLDAARETNQDRHKVGDACSVCEICGKHDDVHTHVVAAMETDG
jgi:hypothetical protein